MKNKVLRILGATTLVLFIGSSLTSCSAEDGIDGINGIDGVDGLDGQDGADGADGADGQDGQDAIGLEEFANYGSINLRVQGVRSDSVAFDQETALEFISPELYQNSFRDRNADLDFHFLRLVDAPNSDEINSVGIEFYVTDADLATRQFNFHLEFEDFAILFEDLSFISINDYFEGTPLSNTNDNNNSTDKVVDGGNSNSPNLFTISDYSFDDSTNNLKFSFEMDVPATNNNSGNDLSIEGTVDVIVFENVSSSSKSSFIIK